VNAPDQHTEPHDRLEDGPQDPAAVLGRAVDRLVAQAAHWQPERWAGGEGDDGTRADRVHALIQRIADLDATAAGRPVLAVPRLGDLVLPDQLRVVAHDLVAAGADADAVLATADDVDAVRRTL
jgi:hypothetical protein